MTWRAIRTHTAKVVMVLVSEEDERRFEDAHEGEFDEEAEEIEDIDEEEQDTQRYIQR